MGSGSMAPGGITASFGFWKGASDEDICYQLTGVAQMHWSLSESAQTECSNMIERHYEAFFTGVMALLYATAVYRCTRAMLW